MQRVEKKYLDAEPPELTLRPARGAALNWPPVMPDFAVLLRRDPGLCWLAYQRFAKRFPHKDLVGGVKNEMLCPDSVVTGENLGMEVRSCDIIYVFV